MRMWSRAALLASLTFLIISSLAATSAAGFPEPVTCVINGATTDMGACLSNSLPLAMIGILLSLSFVGLVYMLGELVNIGSLKNWYRNELKETAKSLMLIVVVISSLVILSGIATSLIGSGPVTSVAPSGLEQNLGNLYGRANSYLTTQQILATDAFGYATGVSLGINLLKSTTLSLWVPLPIVPIPLPPFCAVCLQFGSTENIFKSQFVDSSTPGIAQSLAFVKDSIEILIIPMLLITTAQIDLLPFIMQLGLLVLFPIGIFLRAVPFLRGIGGTLIAIGITIALIYPTVLVAFNNPITSFIVSAIPGQNTFNLGPLSSIPIIGGAFTWLQQYITPIALEQSGAQAGLASWNSIYPAFNSINYYIFPLVVQLILFVLDVIIVVVAAQNIARMLGGSIRLGIGNRLKLA